MAPALEIALLSLAFSGTHIGLTTGPVRGRLVRRLGEVGFSVLFSTVAAVGYATLVVRYAQLRFEGAPGFGLAAVEPARIALLAIAVVGVVFAVCGLVSYPKSPVALFGQRIVGPRGIERITRHPFFVGVGLLAATHALLATRLVGTVFFAGLALVSWLGAWHQDRKMLARRGERYGAFVADSSFVPFAAIVRGRQRLAWGDLPLGGIALGIVAAVLLRSAHPHLFARDGLWIVAATLGGALLATIQAWLRVRGSGTTERLLAGIGWAIVALGTVHVLATPGYEPELGGPALWFASGGGAFILLGFLNVYRRHYADAAPALARVTTIANVATLAFLVALAVVMGVTPSNEPQVLLAIVLMLVATTLSLRRPRTTG